MSLLKAAYMSEKATPFARALVFAGVAGIALSGLLTTVVPGMLEAPAAFWCPDETAELGYEEHGVMSSRRGGVEVTIHCLGADGETLESWDGLVMFLSWGLVSFGVLIVPVYLLVREPKRAIDDYDAF